MASLLARLGQLETRNAAAGLCRERKRAVGWVCAGCAMRVAVAGVRQKRMYADGAAVQWGLRQFDNGRFEEDGEWTGKDEVGKAEQSSSLDKDAKRRSQATEGSESFFTGHAPRKDALGSGVTQDDLWETFEQGDEAYEADAGSTVADEARDATTTTHKAFTPSAVEEQAEAASEADARLLDLDYAAELSPAMLMDDPDLVVRCLFAAERAYDLDFIGGIPDTTFSEILHMLKPSRAIGGWASAHLELSEQVANMLHVGQINKAAAEYASLMRRVVQIRKMSGRRLMAQDYLVLMHGARDLGNRKLASSIWTQFSKDGYKPTTPHYNAYMSSVVWAGVNDPQARYKDRVIPRHQSKRREKRMDHGYWHYHVGPGGVREVALEIFSDMLKDGAPADEESFRHVITAAAREGEMSTVKSILRRVWNIDVDALLQGTPEAELAPRMLPEKSAVYPTSKLLFTLSHAFSINNDIPAALRLTDYVSRTYGVKISEETWQSLFEWTFVLSCRRAGNDVRGGGMIGKLPDRSVQSLWNTMTGAPYFVKPTIGMYNRIIKILFDQRNPSKIVEKMNEGSDLFFASKQRARRAWRKLESAIKATEQGRISETAVSVQRRNWEQADLIYARNLFLLKRWIRLLTGVLVNWNRLPWGAQFTLEEFPKIAWEWRPFIGRTLTYEVPSGLVEIRMMNEDEILRSLQNREKFEVFKDSKLERAKLFVGDDWRRRKRYTPEQPEEAGSEQASSELVQ